MNLYFTFEPTSKFKALTMKPLIKTNELIIMLWLTVVIHYSGLLLTAIDWQANDLHFHKRVNDLKNHKRDILHPLTFAKATEDLQRFKHAIIIIKK